MVCYGRLRGYGETPCLLRYPLHPIPYIHPVVLCRINPSSGEVVGFAVVEGVGGRLVDATGGREREVGVGEHLLAVVVTLH